MNRLSIIRAEFMMRVAGFTMQEHTSPLKQWVATGLRWLGRQRQRSGSLDFLESETSIDHMDYEEIDDAIEHDANS